MSNSRGVTRRTLLRATAATPAIPALAALAGCGTPPAKRTGARPCLGVDASATEKRLTFSSWPLYLDVDEKDASKRPTLDAFTRRTGIEVTYHDDINDNNEFFGRIRNQLQACQSIDRDAIILTDWMASRLVSLGWVQPFDRTRMPNFTRNLLPSLRNRPWDRDLVFAAPWQSGLTGIAYNARVTRPVRTLDELLTRPDLKGRVAVLSELTDTVGLLLLSLGKDPASFTDADFEAALEKLKKAVGSGQIRRFTGNDYKEDLAKGDLAACLAWSGDVIQMSAEDEAITFVVPDEGLLLWADNLLIPATATHRANVERLIDHYYEPRVAAELAAYVQFICPVAGAREAMLEIDPDLADNPLIFPDPAMSSRFHAFRALAEDESRRYTAEFDAVAGA